MTHAPVRDDRRKHGIPIAVGAKFSHLKPVSAVLALRPQHSPRTAEKSQLVRLKRFFKRRAVRIAEHEHVSVYALRDDRNEIDFIPIQTADKRIGKRTLSGLERHTELHVASELFKLHDFFRRRNAACYNNAALHRFSQFFDRVRIGALHAAFFFNAGK